jgi:hypothetical protein
MGEQEGGANVGEGWEGTALRIAIARLVLIALALRRVSSASKRYSIRSPSATSTQIRSVSATRLLYLSVSSGGMRTDSVTDSSGKRRVPCESVAAQLSVPRWTSASLQSIRHPAGSHRQRNKFAAPPPIVEYGDTTSAAERPPEESRITHTYCCFPSREIPARGRTQPSLAVTERTLSWMEDAKRWAFSP